MSRESNVYSKIGAVSYLLLALLNIVAGIMLMTTARTGDLALYLRNVAPAAPPEALAGLNGNPALSGLAFFHAFNYFSIGMMTGFVAVRLNWINDRFGYGLNLALGGWLSAGFLTALVLPGLMPLTNVLPVLGLWLFGAIFTTLATWVRPTVDRAIVAPKSA